MPLRPCLLLILCIPFFASAQKDTGRYKLARELANDLRWRYIDTTIGKQMAEALVEKMTTGGYDPSLNIYELTYEITHDLQNISRDKHVAVFAPHPGVMAFDRDMEARFRKLDKMSRKKIKRYFDRQRKKSRRQYKRYLVRSKKRTQDDMYSYGEIKILPGNIGYVEIKDFGSTNMKRKDNRNRISIHSVMKFLSNTQAIIVDLRDNHGGLVREASRVCSYFSRSYRKYFITCTSYMRWRQNDSITKEKPYIHDYYTSDKNNNDLITGKKIYVLTSSRTFSAGELVTYKIKQLSPSATIVGEHTPGSGNGYFSPSFTRHYSAVIPDVKLTDKKDSTATFATNGVTPDFIVHADSAFNVAYRLSLENNKVSLHIPVRYYKKPSPEPKATITQRSLPDYAGDYRRIVVRVEGKDLYLYYDEIRKIKLVPIGRDQFTSAEFEQITFTRETHGRIHDVRIKKSDDISEIYRKRN